MTVRDVESILLLLSFMILAMPVSVVGAVVLTARHMRKHFDKWMHVYGDDELKARWGKMEAKLEARDDEIAELNADKGALVAIIRCATGANIRTLEQLAGVQMIVRRGKK